MNAAPEWTPPELRPREELLAAIELYTEQWPPKTASDEVWVQGLVAALQWAAGLTDKPPISATPLGRPVTGSDAKHEQYQAYEAMSGTAEPELRAVAQEKGRYVVGVENTLAWAAGGDALAVPGDWPWPQKRR